jgi:adenine-specific DNA-methyltransferase
MPPKNSSKGPNGEDGNPIADYRFEARRPNNPPAGLVSADHAVRETPRTRYAYDPHLSPQLVWADKPGLRSIEVEEQAGVNVDDVTLHIHERVSTRAILEAVQRPGPRQLGLFADPALPLQEALKFYQHDVDWANRLILGDSLLVMGSLLSLEQMRGKVQMIYLDPPYGVNYKSNFQPRIDQRDVREDDSGLTREPEQIQAYRDTWTLGVHSYLTYLRDRLLLCRQLLTESGSIFVQIGDENVHRVRLLMDEVFGTDSFVSQITVAKTTGATSRYLPGAADYLLWYASDAASTKFHPLFITKEIGRRGATNYNRVETPDGVRRYLNRDELADLSILPSGSRPYSLDNLTSQSIGREKGEGAASWFPVTIGGKDFRPGIQVRWKTNEAGMARLLWADRLESTGSRIGYVRYFDDFPSLAISNNWFDVGASFMADKIYVVQTSPTLIQRCMLMTTDPGDLVLDPTCGSGTTAYVAEQWGRRWITCDTSRVAVALARQRLLTATFPYYRLANEARGVDGSFVYKTVPHIQLSDYARNTRIDPIVERYAPLLAEAEARGDDDGVRRLRRERRAEIDKVVAEDSERETIFDQPEIVSGVTRVSGPFTVEAIPPAALELQAATPILGAPEGLDVDAGPDGVDDSAGAGGGARVILVDEAASHIPNLLADLARDGVTFPDNRVLRFAELTPRTGGVIHAEGTAEDDAELDRVGISFGPRAGAVTMAQVEDALYEAREALLGAVVFCGFAFEPEAQAFISDTNRRGRVRTFMAHIRPDTVLTDARGESLLKTRSDSQVFAVFGEPDVELIGPDADSAYRVEMRGVDVYDPLTGRVHSASVSQVAAWFVDSDYDRRAFCICQAFFPNVDAWEKIGRALKGKLDEEKLDALRGSVSLPFKPGQHKRVAVKVIDQRGNEVMRVLSLESAAPLAYAAASKRLT